MEQSSKRIEEASALRVKAERDQAVRILRMLVEAASADALEDFSRTSNVADMAAGFLRVHRSRREFVSQTGRGARARNARTFANEASRRFLRKPK